MITPVPVKSCALYKTHRCAVIDTHHVCPKSWFLDAHRPVDTPMIELCPNCHMNTHAAIDGLIRGRDITAVPARCVSLALRAMNLAAAAGLTPTPTL